MTGTPHPIYEPLVNIEQARHILGGDKPFSRSYMWAVKKAMSESGCSIGRKFLASTVRQWILDHPDFNSKHQFGETSLLREVLAYLKDPRLGRRSDLIGRLEARLRNSTRGRRGAIATRVGEARIRSTKAINGPAAGDPLENSL